VSEPATPQLKTRELRPRGGRQILVTQQRVGVCCAGSRSSDLRLAGHWSEDCARERGGPEACVAGRKTFYGTQTGACVSDGRKLYKKKKDPLGLIGVCVGGKLDGTACFGEDDTETCVDGTCTGAFCEVESWCPVELSAPNASVPVRLDGWQDFSVCPSKPPAQLRSAETERRACSLSRSHSEHSDLARRSRYSFLIVLFSAGGATASAENSSNAAAGLCARGRAVSRAGRAALQRRGGASCLTSHDRRKESRPGRAVL
jgi:hypothetical protein